MSYFDFIKDTEYHKKPYIQNKPPFHPTPYRFDDRPVSKQIYKIDNTNLNAEMSNIIIY